MMKTTTTMMMGVEEYRKPLGRSKRDSGKKDGGVPKDTKEGEQQQHEHS